MCDFHPAVSSAPTLDSKLAAAPRSVQPAVLRSLLQHTDAGPMLHIKLYELSQKTRAAAAIALCAESMPAQVQLTLRLASKQLFVDGGPRRSAAKESLAMAKDAVTVKSAGIAAEPTHLLFTSRLIRQVANDQASGWQGCCTPRSRRCCRARCSAAS